MLGEREEVGGKERERKSLRTLVSHRRCEQWHRKGKGRGGGAISKHLSHTNSSFSFFFALSHENLGCVSLVLFVSLNPQQFSSDVKYFGSEGLDIKQT